MGSTSFISDEYDLLSASKAALNSMTVSPAKAAAADGVTVNAVSPGTIHSADLNSRFREVDVDRGLAVKDAPCEIIEHAVLPMLAALVPVGRVGRLDEITGTIAFVASPLAGYTTGMSLRVDGGLSPGL